MPEKAVTLESGNNMSAIDDHGYVRTVPFLHDMIHEGKLWSYTDHADLEAAATYQVLVQVAETRVSMLWLLSSSDEGDMYIYEGATFSAAGTGVTLINHDRDNGDPINVTVTHTPTITDDGAGIYHRHLHTGKQQGGESEGGEFYLAANTDYLVRFESHANGNTIRWGLLFHV